MEQRISIITLGVQDVERSRLFYEFLGWKPSPKSDGNIVFFQAGNIVVALYPWALLASDATVSPEGHGFRGVALAYNVRNREDVSTTLAEAEVAGATLIKPAQDVFWGGHSGYFADLDGHLWEVAWNPFAVVGDDGSFKV